MTDNSWPRKIWTLIASMMDANSLTTSIPVTIVSGGGGGGSSVAVIPFTDSSTNLAGSAVFTGTARTLALANMSGMTSFGAEAFADQAGTLDIQHSLDTGSTWFTVATSAVNANEALEISVPLRGALTSATQYRVRYTNGGTPQTSFKLSSAFLAN